MSDYNEDDVILEPGPVVTSSIDFYIQQVRDCCSCFECASEEQWEGAVITALENWGTLTCGNWINEHKIDLRIPFKKRCGGCCPRIVKINLPETFIQPETIEVKIIRWVGLETAEIVVDSIFDSMTHNLRIDVSDIQDCCDCCTEYEIIVSYIVGTDEIPPELCRWFCAIAKVYMQIEQVACTTCSQLEELEDISLGGVFETIELLAVKYFDDVIERYSLCMLKSLQDWSVVV